jgi:hypothetical protein
VAHARIMETRDGCHLEHDLERATAETEKARQLRVIVVLANRHDPVATDLVARWPSAALCSAEDLTRPGWVWPVTACASGARWVIDGSVVPDERVTGVFVRRSNVHAEELTSTHRDDRVYLAAEAHAFLVHVLARTAAVVVNPVDDTGAYGEGALRPERWMKVAADAGVAVAPFRVSSAGEQHPAGAATTFEVVAEQALGDPPKALAAAAVNVCRRLGLHWAVTSFDESGRLAAMTTTPAPSLPASGVLARLLAGLSAA